tara:strand:- start:1753 stop:2004 length:252 start_codon:yes stop_codon:yes gene_type:complete
MRALVVAAVLAVAMCGVSVAADLAMPVVSDAAGPTQANVVNPYELLDLPRAALAERFPNMPAAELDKLAFKIADINSMRAPQR